jgi:branched-chain amino acid transport system substrate-binding protein
MRIAQIAGVFLIAIVVGTVGYQAGFVAAPVKTVEVPGKPPEPPRTILIGGTVPLTGPLSLPAGKLDKLYLTWADMINKRGGLYVREYNTSLPVKVILYDDKSDPATAARFYEKLITEDKVDIIIGSFSGTLHIPVAPIAERYGIPFVHTAAAETSIYEQGYQWSVEILSLIYFWSQAYIELLKSEGKVKTISFVIEDLLYGNEIAAGGARKAQEAGITVLSMDRFAQGAIDFTPIIIKLKDLNPDVIFVASGAASAITFVKQANEKGLKPKELHVSQLFRPFVNAVGSDVANYMTGEWFWTEGVSYTGKWGINFWKELQQRSGVTNDAYPYAVINFVGLEVIAAAIEEAGSLNKAKIMNALRNLNMITTMGPLRFRDFQYEEGGVTHKVNGVGTLTAFPVQFVSGSFVALWPPEIASGKHIYLSP